MGPRLKNHYSREWIDVRSFGVTIWVCAQWELWPGARDVLPSPTSRLESPALSHTWHWSRTGRLALRVPSGIPRLSHVPHHPAGGPEALHHVQGPESLRGSLGMATERKTPSGREEAGSTDSLPRRLSHSGPHKREQAIFGE